jgi:hypothetical protein
MGDLPGIEVAKAHGHGLSNWIGRGGKLVYFTGWKDHWLIRHFGDVFGVDVGPEPQIISKPVETRIVPGALPLEILDSPAAKYVTVATLTSAERIIDTSSGNPFLVRNSFGLGEVYLFLGPVSYPAGAPWLYWSHFGALIHWIVGAGFQSRGRRRDPLLLEYADVHEMVSIGAMREAIERLDILIARSRPVDVILACEAANLKDRLAGAVNDPLVGLSALFTLDELLSHLPAAVQTYDYCDGQRPWYAMEKSVDCMHLLARHSDEFAADAMKYLRDHISQRRRFISEADAVYLQGFVALITAFRDALAFGKTNYDTALGLAAARRVVEAFQKSVALVYGHPQAEFFYRLVEVFFCSLPFLETSEFRDDRLSDTLQIDELRAIAERLTYPYLNAEDATLLIDVASLLRAGRDTEAWRQLLNVDHPILRSIGSGFLTLAANLQRDPLALFTGFAENADIRQNLYLAVQKLLRYRNEGRPVTIRLAMRAGFPKPEDETGRLNNIDLSEPGAIDRLARYSGVYDIFDVDLSAKVYSPSNVSAIPPVSHALVPLKERHLADLTADGNRIGLSVNSGLGHARIFANGSVLAESKGAGWIRPKHTPSALNPASRMGVALDEVCRRVLDLHDTLPSEYHGGAALVVEDPNPYSSLGQLLARPILIESSLPMEKFAGMLGIDGAILVRVSPRPEIMATECTLPAYAEDVQHVLELNPLLRAKGTRHRNCVGFTLRHPDVYVLIFSEDGPATLAANGIAIPLW